MPATKPGLGPVPVPGRVPPHPRTSPSRSPAGSPAIPGPPAVPVPPHPGTSPSRSPRPRRTSPGPRTCWAPSAEPAGPAQRRHVRTPRHHVRLSRRRATFIHQGPIRAGRAARPRPLPARRPRPAVTPGPWVRDPAAAAGTRGQPEPTRVAWRGHGPPCSVFGVTPRALLAHRPRCWCWGHSQFPAAAPAQGGEQQGTPRGCSICSREGRSLWVPWGQP